jgi:hypothetical protein
MADLEQTQLAEREPKLNMNHSIKGLSTRKYLGKSTGNLHACLSNECQVHQCPLPKMFGEEKYGYTVIDIDDPRYVHEAAENSEKLNSLQSDKLIIQQVWAALYAELQQAEHRLGSLPKNAPQKTVKEKQDLCNTLKEHLLKFQQQRDMYEDEIAKIDKRCDQIKTSMAKEKQLETLREELTERTRATHPADSEFWKTTFNVSSGSQGVA